MQTGELYIYNLSEDNAKVDTMQLKSGKFVYAGVTGEPTPYLLVYPNAIEHVIFVEGGATLHYQAHLSDLKNYTVEGSEENELMNAFRRAAKDLEDNQMPQAARSFIEQYPTSLSAVYLFDRYVVQTANVQPEKAAELLTLLRTHHPDNRFLQGIEGELKNLKKGKVGSLLPAVKLTTRSNRTLQLGPDSPASRKKARVIFFWATWMPDSWRFSSELRNLANDYYYMAKIDVVCISLDTEIYRWEENVTTDSLSVSHVCDGRAWDTPLVESLGIRNLPTYVMVDKQNKIIARGTTFDQLKNDIHQHLFEHY